MSLRTMQMLICLSILSLLLITLPALAAEPARTVYVDNVTGADTNNGLSAVREGDGKTGPVATIMQAVRLAGVGASIAIANTGTPYRESVSIQGFKKGRAATPLVIEGNGATVTGLVAVPAARWIHLRDDIYWFENKLPDGKYGDMPNSNWLGFLKHQGWFTEPQAPKIFFLDGVAAAHVTKLDEIPQGGFFYDTQATPRRLYFRLPVNKTLDQVKIDMPLNTGVYVSDDYVVVRNLASSYSQDDGFSGFWGIGVVFENINGSNNCDQGYSMHGTSTSIVDGGLFEHNGGAGIVDVMSCMSIFRNVVVRDNMIGGVLFQGHAHSMLGCRVYGNRDNQIMVGQNATASFTNCLVIGDGHGTGIDLQSGRLDRVTIVNCDTGLRVWRNASVTSSIISNCAQEALWVAKDAKNSVNVSKSLLGLGAALFGETRVTKEQWAEFVASSKQLSDIAIDPPALDGPLFLLPKDSPYRTFGQNGMPPGAQLVDETPWQAISTP
ncbi:MAG TPA: right-handed parallel beta-helix repeat-containing protein [Armatimonadota bacterium]|jgi:hypothetical protein